jgi:hypothetical protein
MAQFFIKQKQPKVYNAKLSTNRIITRINIPWKNTRTITQLPCNNKYPSCKNTTGKRNKIIAVKTAENMKECKSNGKKQPGIGS